MSLEVALLDCHFQVVRVMQPFHKVLYMGSILLMTIVACLGVSLPIWLYRVQVVQFHQTEYLQKYSILKVMFFHHLAFLGHIIFKGHLTGFMGKLLLKYILVVLSDSLIATQFHMCDIFVLR